MIMLRNNILLSLIAAFACGLGALVHGESARESFGVDFGNASSTTQEGWTNASFTATRAGAANTFVNVPLSRNGAASSSSIMAGSLFGNAVYLSVSAKASVGNFNNLLSSNTLWTWQENSASRGTHAAATPDSPSAFDFPNHCEAFNTSGRLSANGTPGATATARVSLSGLLPGKEYTVSFFMGSNKPQYQSVSLVSGELKEVNALQTSSGTLNGATWTGAVNTAEGDIYMAVEWKACADTSGVLEFDVTKKANASASGRMELNALTVMTDGSPAPPAPEPRPVSVLNNRALTSLPAAVALPVPADTWSSSREMTCELWIKPEGDSSSGRILSLGNISLSLNRGKLQLSFPGQEGETVLEASGDVFAAGSWHHVAVSLDAENARLYVDGAAAGSLPGAPFLAAAEKAWNGVVLDAEFRGARDEVRFWNASLGDDIDDFFLTGPLPMAHPRYDRLVGLWRLDGDFRDAKWTEFAEKTGSALTRSYQAVAPAGAEFSIVADNSVFRYMLVTGYVRESHIMWNWPNRSHMINNSDLIYIGSASPAANGEINFSYPDNDVTESRGVRLLPSDGTRTNVLEFSGDGACMYVGNGLVTGNNANAFTIEINMALSAGEQNVTLFENDSVSMTLSWADGHYKARLQVGSSAAWEADLPAIALHEYFWLSFIRNSAEGTGVFYVNGSAVATAKASPGNMNGTANAVVGRDLQGRIDEMRVWHLARPVNRLGTEVQPNWNDRLIVARWGNSDIFGRDTASWAEHLRSLRKWTEGVSGMRIRLGIAGGAWSSMISNAAARQRFADNIAELIKKYPLDGVDLDFEWMYENTAQWNQYGMLAQAIRTACPDMFFSISLHTVSYKFPAAYMQYVDYFTFQNYGPSIDVNTYNSMVTACGNFRKQGFPDNKIILSAPFQGTPGGSSPGAYIKGYRDIAANCPEADNPDNDTAVYTYSDGTRTLHYNGVTTIKKKAKYISDQKLAGFMYWDLGLDLADSAGRNNYFDRRSLLRAANRYVSSTSFPDTPSPFSLSRVGAVLPAEGGTADVEVQMEEENLGWMVTVRPEWLSVSADSGIGRTTVVLTAGENKSGRPRSGTVVFRASEGQECSVSVTQEAPETAGYDKWVQDKFPSGTAGDQTAPEAAPSGDGIVNLMKYATGLDPLRPCGSVTSVTAKEGEDGKMHLVLSWPVNPDAMDVKHEVEASTDLETWTLLGEAETAGKTSAEFMDPEAVGTGRERRFLRLKVTRE